MSSPRATWASNQVCKDVSSYLDDRLGIFKDREQRRGGLSVLQESLGSSSLLLGAAVAHHWVWASTALNIQGFRGLILRPF